MINRQTDRGVISAYLRRMRTQRLARAQAMKVRVDRGETLNDYDLAFLERVFNDARSIQPLILRNPAYQQLGSKLLSLYLDIARRALENEQQQGR